MRDGEHRGANDQFVTQADRVGNRRELDFVGGDGLVDKLGDAAKKRIVSQEHQMAEKPDKGGGQCIQNREKEAKRLEKLGLVML